MMIETNSPEETYAFGKKLGMEAQAGQVYCLNGDLGVGKTVFTQGFAAGLGIQEPVNSPTFTIVQEYIVSAMWTRWMRLAMRTIYTARVSA